MQRRAFITLLAATPAASTAAGDAPQQAHLLGQIDRPAVREQIVHEIRTVYDGQVIWGADLMRLTVGDSRISTIESRQG